MTEEIQSATVRGDPGVLAVGAFAYAMLVFGIFELGYEPAGAALTFALLFAAIAEVTGGLLNIVKGETYLGTVTAFFGAWLFGFYFLAQSGAADASVGVYILTLLVPVLIFWVPPFRDRDVVGNGAYATVAIALLFSGMGNVLSRAEFHPIAGVSSILAAVFLFYMAGSILMEEVESPASETPQSELG
jgi:succinate-acetate transporter protein